MNLHRPAIILIAATVVVLAGSPVSRADGLVPFEAESGALGSEFAISNSASPVYVTDPTAVTYIDYDSFL